MVLLLSLPTSLFLAFPWPRLACLEDFCFPVGVVKDVDVDLMSLELLSWPSVVASVATPSSSSSSTSTTLELEDMDELEAAMVPLWVPAADVVVLAPLA